MRQIIAICLIFANWVLDTILCVVVLLDLVVRALRLDRLIFLFFLEFFLLGLLLRPVELLRFLVEVCFMSLMILTVLASVDKATL